MPSRFFDIGLVSLCDKASNELKPFSAKSHLASTPPHKTASQILFLIKSRAISKALILDEHAVDIVKAGPLNPTSLHNISAGVPSSSIDTENPTGITPDDILFDICFCASCTAVLLDPKTTPRRFAPYLSFISSIAGIICFIAPRIKS